MKTVTCFVLLVAFAAFGALTRAETPAGLPYANADVEGFEKLTKQEGVVILDVRTPEEYAAGHLAGATLIDIKGKDFAEKIGKLDKTKTYAVYCRSGNRSSKACEQMAKLEFTHLTNLVGGINYWQKEKKPVVTDAAK